MPQKVVEFINLKQIGQPLERAAARLAALHYSRGRRVLIRAGGQAEAEGLDKALWTFDPASFVPHGLAGAEGQESEPVLITTADENPNMAEVWIGLHPPSRLPLEDYEHLVQMIPGEEGPEIIACRELYREMSNRNNIRLLHTTRLP